MTIDTIWQAMFDAAKAVQNGWQISRYVEAGGVAAAILSASGKIYTGVCVDTCKHVEIMLDTKTGRVVALGELTPEWWI